MKKLHKILIGCGVAGLLAGALVLSGCTRTGEVVQGYQGRRYAEAAQAGRGDPRHEPLALRDGLAAGGGYGQRGQGRLAEDGLGYGQGYGSSRALPPQPTEVSGRGVVESGTLSSLTGTLEAEGTEWYLQAAERRFALHFGNTSYVQSTGVPLAPGASVQVRGFVDGNELAVASIDVDGQRFAFRTDEGVPLWAGRGRQSGGGGRGEGGAGLRRRAI